jgi:hypothetical protein
MVARLFFDSTPFAFTHDVPSPFVPTAHQKQAMKWQSITFYQKPGRIYTGDHWSSMQRLDFGNVQNCSERKWFEMIGAFVCRAYTGKGL